VREEPVDVDAGSQKSVTPTDGPISMASQEQMVIDDVEVHVVVGRVGDCGEVADSAPQKRDVCPYSWGRRTSTLVFGEEVHSSPRRCR
jgi:hypothetical protein